MHYFATILHFMLQIVSEPTKMAMKLSKLPVLLISWRVIAKSQQPWEAYRRRCCKTDQITINLMSLITIMLFLQSSHALKDFPTYHTTCCKYILVMLKITFILNKSVLRKVQSILRQHIAQRLRASEKKYFIINTSKEI